jgi:thiol-disulfide isomerase/thioredoxin
MRVPDWAAAVFVLSCALSTASAAPVLEEGAPAPWIAARDDEGRAVTLPKIFKQEPWAKAILVQFWGSYCPPCLKELDVISKSSETLKADGIAVLLVNVEDSTEGAKAIMASRRFPGCYAMRDATGAVAETARLSMGGTLTLPLSWVVGRDGLRVLRVLKGKQEDFLQAVRAASRGPGSPANDGGTE